MNDFTREELQEILDAMHEVEYEHSARPEKVLAQNPLYIKIQSMIANYCEHEWENPCCGCPSSAPYCTKCDRTVYE